MPSEAAKELRRERVAPSLKVRYFFVLALCCLVAIVVIYLPSLNYQFVLDDHSFTTHPTIQESGHFWDYFTNSSWAQVVGGPASFYRPIFLVWLRINYLLSGLSPWGWHLLSIAKHLLAATLLAMLIWKLLHDSAAALIAATLFALHPAQTESVSWITVPDPLMTAGVLAALFFYLEHLEGSSLKEPETARTKKSRKSSANEIPRHWKWFAASVATYFLALLSKETAIIVPAVIFAMNLLPTPNRTTIARSKPNTVNAIQWKQSLVQTLPFILVTGIYFLLRASVLGNVLGTSTQHLPVSTVIFSWPGILWFYLKVIFWPIRSYAFADPILIESFSVRKVILPLAALACAATILVAFFLWARKKTRRELDSQTTRGIVNALIIGTLLLILPLLLALNLNALNPGDFLHGRYAYLSVAGLMLLLATAWHVANQSRTVLLVPACVIAIAFATLTFAQEKQWKDDTAIFTTAHQLAPQNVPVARHLADTHVQAALQLSEEDRCAEALPIFAQVISDFPDDWFAWAGEGDCYFQLNDLPKAEESLHRASNLAHNPKVTEHWQELRAHMGLSSSSP